LTKVSDSSGEVAVNNTVFNTNLSPRLLRLLELLLRSADPVKVDVLASSLGTSRRTVFRELENADAMLASFHAALVSIPGRGIAFLGNDEVREKLLDALSDYSLQPASKRERLLRLVIELITNAGEVQKLYYYASILGVSESTISNDLDELESWLSARGITVTRKSGAGIQCDGTEESLRAALVSRFMTDGGTGGKSYTAAFTFPGEDIETGVREILRRKTSVIDWMTAESFNLIFIYLMVSVERVYDGKIITSKQTSEGAFQSALAEELAVEIEKQFSLILPEIERLALAGWIQACRAKQDSPLEPGTKDQQELARRLTLQMIDRFDPTIAAILKMNEQLTGFLSRHLESTLTRLRGGIELPNPLEAELIKSYPEVYEKTRVAAKVLEEYLGIQVPSSEISFIQIHFLAALTVLGERNIRRRILRAGVICVSGIGTSYMLAYQIRKRFKGELEVEIASYAEQASWSNADFLISTIPLNETEKPFILVRTILKEDDYQKIQEAISAQAFTERGAEQPLCSFSLEKRLDKLIDIFMQSRFLLDNFSVETIKADCSFEELTRFAAVRFAPENVEVVCKALIARESVHTQVVAELEIILLHTRSAAKSAPVFACIVPEGGVFTDKYFKSAKSCVLMLLPEHTPREMIDLMGSISSALIDMPVFLEAVHAGNRENIQTVLEREISETLAQCKGETLI
jgi:mannitol operon transcriptional antiterminator